jgi:hypothetical protein
MDDLRSTIISRGWNWGLIEGDRILTNAHVVLYASDIEVQATEGSSSFNTARSIPGAVRRG